MSPTPGNPEAFLTHIKGAPTATPEEYRTLKKDLPDIEPMFNMFKDRTDIEVRDIEEYLQATTDSGNAFHASLQALAEKMKDPTLPIPERLDVESTFVSLATYINKRNTILLQSESGLHKLRQTVVPSGMNQEQIPQVDKLSLTTIIPQTTSDLLKAYSNAKNPSDKLLLLGGAAIAIIAILKGGQLLFTSTNSGARTVRNLGGLAIAALAFNRAYTLARGKPLLGENPLTGNKDANERAYKEQLQAALKGIKDNHVDDAFITKMMGVGSTPEDLRYVKGISNLGALSVDEFLDIYEKSKTDQAVQNEDWPDYPCADSREFKQHNLSARERFAVLTEMGKTIGLIDVAGNVSPDIKDEEREWTVFYKILNRPS